MKNVKQIAGIALLTLCIGTTISCNANTKPKKEITLATQALANTKKPEKNVVKVALLLDTSNSMDGLINQAKAQLWDIVNKFSYVKCGNEVRPELQIALYEYGNSTIEKQDGYIRQVLNFSNDLDEISEKLFSLTTNGGDEYCGEAISTSIKNLDWGTNPDNLKMIFIAGNEPFNQGKLDYKDATSDAKEKGIVVNTIFCGDYNQGTNSHWKNGAQLTGGEYIAINHNKKVIHIDTPYDDVIITLNKKLNKTYVSYGSLGSSKMALQSVQDDKAAEMEEAVMVKRAVSKSSRLYNNASWDLVDASKNKNFSVSKIDKKQLPKELQNKSTKEIEAFIETKEKQRKTIQQQIKEANTKREAYIAKNQKEGSKGELENAMISAIVKQGKSKNYTWDK
ncbi:MULTISPECIES: vWA domain-containing protein [unclassified Cellulophaga]|uniref:vWA domain-containing protein n=1 Tax=unclassified Cellulophaga TaxID=2634405 RepID=UPI0026E46600|nr:MULTISPECIES: vWA domain-containing protein [unclassified Cellulophaga]MDO6490309.1 VWA domain-containing protein [Cellulophaga sp. 2_MG-2023]MDO6494497.1 VWA domain-containing protein [Cellulophaga sp. 3_MG-2023]